MYLDDPGIYYEVHGEGQPLVLLNGIMMSTPSWVDHLAARVSRLPGPNSSYYLGLGLVLFLAQAVVLWVEGAFPVGRVHSAHLFLAAAIPYQLAMIHYFDRRAAPLSWKSRGSKYWC